MKWLSAELPERNNTPENISPVPGPRRKGKHWRVVWNEVFLISTEAVVASVAILIVALSKQVGDICTNPQPS